MGVKIFDGGLNASDRILGFAVDSINMQMNWKQYDSNMKVGLPSISSRAAGEHTEESI